MKIDRTIWLARHGTRQDMIDPTWKPRAERPFDPPLAQQGLDEADCLAARMAETNVKHIFCSPFLRTVQTAHPTAKKLGLPLRIDPAAGELLRADWFPTRPIMIQPDVLQRDFPQIDTSYSPPPNNVFPETAADVYVRCVAALPRLLAQFDGDLLIIGHGATLQGFGRAIVGQDTFIETPITGVCKFTLAGGRWTMELNGCTKHLDALQRSEI